MKTTMKEWLNQEKTLAKALIIFVSLMLFVYNVCIKWLNFLFHIPGDTVITVCVSLFLLLSSLLFAVRHHIDIWKHGITPKQIAKNCFLAVYYSCFMGVGIIILKIFLLSGHHQIVSIDNIFQPEAQFLKDRQFFRVERYIIYISVYSVTAILQEFIARGVIQNTLEKIFIGSSKWWPIIIVSMLFAAVHTHKSVNYAAMSFFLGIFWGWLYNKQHTLTSVCFSHILIGVWAAFIVGVQHLL